MCIVCIKVIIGAVFVFLYRHLLAEQPEVKLEISTISESIDIEIEPVSSSELYEAFRYRFAETLAQRITIGNQVTLTVGSVAKMIHEIYTVEHHSGVNFVRVDDRDRSLEALTNNAQWHGVAVESIRGAKSKSSSSVLHEFSSNANSFRDGAVDVLIADADSTHNWIINTRSRPLLLMYESTQQETEEESHDETLRQHGYLVFPTFAVRVAKLN